MAWTRIKRAWRATQQLADQSPWLKYHETRRSLARDAVVDLSDDMVAAQDNAFRYIYFNDAYRLEFKSLWGIDLEPGASMIDALAAWPEDLQHAKDLWSRALGGESFIDTARFGPPEIAKVYELRYHPIRDAAGNRLGAAHIVRNVTDRFEKEQRLRVRERRADLLARLSDATRTLTDAHEICRAAIRLLRESLDADRCVWADVEGDENHFTFIGVEVRPGVASVTGRYPVASMGTEALQKMRAGRAFVCADAQNDLPDGAERAAYAATGVRALLATPLHKAGRFVAGTGVHMASARQWTAEEIDLTLAVTERCGESIDRARAEVALRESDRRKDEFLARLAHDLRAHLTPLRNALTSLAIAHDAEERARLHSSANMQLKRFARLADDLLEVSHLARGHIKLVRMRTELADVVHHAVAASAARRGQRQLTVDLPQRAIHLYGDVSRLTQVFSNLLDNAYRATAPTGRISISAALAGTTLTVRLRDDGAGIAAEDVGRIFEMFVQGRTDDSDEHGLGVGLTLARALVEMHGGTVDAHSEGLGNGSEFVVRLRALADQSEPAGDQRATSTTTPRLRVLVVDDNRNAAWSASTLLALWGHDVEVAFDGRSAVEKARLHDTELMLLDLGMPEIDGYEVCRTLRAEPWADNMSIVALTGWEQPEERERRYQAGFDAHLVKPIGEASLAALFENPGPIWSRISRRSPRPPQSDNSSARALREG